MLASVLLIAVLLPTALRPPQPPPPTSAQFDPNAPPDQNPEVILSELSAGTEVHVPMESGWLSKRVEVHGVKLDKLVVTEVAFVLAAWRLVASPAAAAPREFPSQAAA